MTAQERRQSVNLRVAGVRLGAGRLSPVSYVRIGTVRARGRRQLLGRVVMGIAHRNRHRHHRNGESRQIFDTAQIGPLLVAAERDCRPGGAGARRSPDPVHIILGHVRQLEIDDMRDVVHVDPARRNVGGDEHAAVAVAKAGERTLALGLRFVAVDGSSLDAGRDRGAAQRDRRRAWCG